MRITRGAPSTLPSESAARSEEYQDELDRRRRISFAVRQGLNTGLVVVGAIGSDLRMDYTAVGDTANVAAG